MRDQKKIETMRMFFDHIARHLDYYLKDLALWILLVFLVKDLRTSVLSVLESHRKRSNERSDGKA